MATKKAATKKAATKKAATKKAATKKAATKKAVAKERSVWPCTMHISADGYSITCEDFARFEHLTKGDAGGYFVQRIARKLARDNDPTLLKRLDFDSEASLFCAFGKDRDALERSAGLLRTVCSGSEKDALKRAATPVPPLAEVESFLHQGFVAGLDPVAQAELLKRAPAPNLTAEEAKHLAALDSKDAEARCQAGRRIHGDARTKIFNWGEYLSHPATAQALMTALDEEEDRKARQEILCALVWMCSRHLPDLRAKPYFERAMMDKQRPIRFLGIVGSAALTQPSWPELIRLAKEDRLPEIRQQALLAVLANMTNPTVARWGGFTPCEQKTGPREEWIALFVSLLADDEATIRGVAARCLAAAKVHLETVQAALKREKSDRAREHMDIAIKMFAGQWR